MHYLNLQSHSQTHTHTHTHMASQYGSIVMSASQLQRKCHNHFDALLNRNSKTVNCRHLLNNTNRALKISKFYRFCHFLSNHLVLLKAAFRNNSCDIKTTRTNSAELTGTGDRSGSSNEREIWNLIVLCSKLWCEHRRTTCLHSSAPLIDWLIDWLICLKSVHRLHFHHSVTIHHSFTLPLHA